MYVKGFDHFTETLWKANYNKCYTICQWSLKCSFFFFYVFYLSTKFDVFFIPKLLNTELLLSVVLSRPLGIHLLLPIARLNAINI